MKTMNLTLFSLLALVGTGYSQDEDVLKARRLQQEAAAVKITAFKIEESLERGDYLAIKNILIDSQKKIFNADAVENINSVDVGNLAKGQPDKFSINENVLIMGKEHNRAIIRAQSDKGHIRTFYLAKEATGWRLFLVTPSSLDNFFAVALGDQATKPIPANE